MDQSILLGCCWFKSEIQIFIEPNYRNALSFSTPNTHYNKKNLYVMLIYKTTNSTSHKFHFSQIYKIYSESTNIFNYAMDNFLLKKKTNKKQNLWLALSNLPDSFWETELTIVSCSLFCGSIMIFTTGTLFRESIHIELTGLSIFNIYFSILVLLYRYVKLTNNTFCKVYHNSRPSIVKYIRF